MFYLEKLSIISAPTIIKTYREKILFPTECVTQVVVSRAHADGRSGVWDPGKS